MKRGEESQEKRRTGKEKTENRRKEQEGRKEK